MKTALIAAAAAAPRIAAAQGGEIKFGALYPFSGGLALRLQPPSLTPHAGAAAAAEIPGHRHHPALDPLLPAQLLIPHGAEVRKKRCEIGHLVKVSVHSPPFSCTWT